MEGDQRLETPLPARLEDRRVATEGDVVDLPRYRLDSGPFDAEAKRVAAQRRGAIEVLLVVVPEIHGQPRRLDTPRPLPTDPVVGGLARPVEAALDLEPRGGHPEAETGGEDVAAAPRCPRSSRGPFGGIRHASQHGTALDDERKGVRGSHRVRDRRRCHRPRGAVC